MKPREFPLIKYENPRDITIKNVISETKGIVKARGSVYVSQDLVGKKVIILEVEDDDNSIL